LPGDCQTGDHRLRLSGPHWSKAKSRAESLQGFADLLMIRERILLSRDLLSMFMALPGDDQRVAGLKHPHCPANGFAPIAYFNCIRYRGHDFGANFRRLLGARIIVGDDGDIGQTPRDLAHDRALATIAIAAAAEHNNDTTGGEGTNRLKHILQSLRLLRIIHIDLRSVLSGAREFKPP